MPAETHSHGSAAHDPSVVGALVVDRLAELLGRDIDDVRPEARLRDDLDAAIGGPSVGAPLVEATRMIPTKRPPIIPEG